MGAPAKVLGKSSAQISLGASDEDIVLEGITKEPLVLLLHGWPVQLLTTRLGRKPCQAPAMSPLAAWLTMVMLRRHPPHWRHRRRVPMPW